MKKTIKIIALFIGIYFFTAKAICAKPIIGQLYEGASNYDPIMETIGCGSQNSWCGASYYAWASGSLLRPDLIEIDADGAEDIYLICNEEYVRTRFSNLIANEFFVFKSPIKLDAEISKLLAERIRFPPNTLMYIEQGSYKFEKIGKQFKIRNLIVRKMQDLQIVKNKRDVDCMNQLFADDYENASKWDWKVKNYISSTTSCFGPLGPGQPQGTISVNGGRVNFNQVAGAHENRIVRSINTLLDRNFELRFDVNVQPSPGGSEPAFFPAVLTSNPNLEPTYVTPVTSCNVYSPMDEIAVSLVQPVNGTNLLLGIQLLDNGTRILPAGSITVSLNTTLYVSLKVYGNGLATLFAYSNPSRTTLIGSPLSFQVPSSLNSLAYLQHSIASGGGYRRLTTAWVDNTQICELAKQCCASNFSGPKVVCNSDMAGTGQTYAIAGVNNIAGFKANPADVSFTRNGNSITVTNWGAINAAPKIVSIIDSFFCEGRIVYDTNLVYIHPRLDAKFNVAGLGTNGNFLTNFTNTSTYFMPGTLHLWQIYLSNNTGAEIQRIRDPFWWSWVSGNPSIFSVKTVGVPGYPDLTSGNFYLIKHNIYFDDGLCGGVESTRLIFTSAQLKLAVDLGSPSDADYAKKMKVLLEQIKRN